MIFFSKNPATQEIVWQGKAATQEEVREKITRLYDAQPSWMRLGVDKRSAILKQFQTVLDENSQLFAKTISEEMGKPLWESLHEVRAMKNKIDISLQAYQERCPTKTDISTVTRHFPHGVVAVFGPYNFPGHLPHGHIVPALLAGNSVIFKPSELTPKTGELYVELWMKAGLASDVLQLVQGGKDVASTIVQDERIRGIFFTGSVQAGMSIQENSLRFPSRILALEMGGNNPLILGKYSDSNAAVFHTIQSAFITSGQRCTCARRLIIVENGKTETFLSKLSSKTSELTIGPYTQTPQPYMGPLVSKEAKDKVLQAFSALKKKGGRVLNEMKDLKAESGFLTPGIIDVTGLEVEDTEIFGPLLQVIRVKNLDDAIQLANNTRYGLSAGILTDEKEEYLEVLYKVRAGVINWNAPLTGASSKAPFGGLGLSGNFRPSAFYAADYSAYPVASSEASRLELPPEFPPGFAKL